jgi:uncharacterized OsmC-like protein
MTDPMPNWTAEARYTPDRPLDIHVGALPLERALAEAPPSPVEYLLVSVASCYALSVAGAVKRAGLPPRVVNVTADGWRNAEPVPRVVRIALRIASPDLDDAVRRAEIIAAAKQLCTVSNSLADAPIIDIAFAGEAGA